MPELSIQLATATELRAGPCQAATSTFPGHHCTLLSDSLLLADVPSHVSRCETKSNIAPKSTTVGARLNHQMAPVGEEHWLGPKRMPVYDGILLLQRISVLWGR